jgi:hypothetical protein
MERARHRAWAGRSPCAIDANGKAHQRRISERGVYPACQHHDPRARHGPDAIRAARAGRERTAAVSAPGVDRGCVHAGSGEKAAGAETAARSRAGSAFAGCSRPRRSTGGCGAVMLSKSAARR